MKGANVAGIYLALTSIAAFVILVIPGAPLAFALMPLSASTIGFLVFLPQSVEFLVLGAFFQGSLPAWLSAVVLAVDLLVGLGLAAT